MRLQRYVQGLNSHSGLYAALVAAQRRSGRSLTPEAARVALTLRHDFERGGIHLEGDRRRRLEEATGRVVRLGMTFQQNLSDPTSLGHVDVARSALGGLPSSLLERIPGGPPPHARVVSITDRSLLSKGFTRLVRLDLSDSTCPTRLVRLSSCSEAT